MPASLVDLHALRQLSIAERLQLVEDLWDSIAQDAPDEALLMTPELAAELDRRLADHERDPTAAQSWDVVRARLLDPARPRQG